MIEYMKNYRKLTDTEKDVLVSHMCTATDWDDIEVVDGFDAKYVRNCRFSGRIRMGKFEKVFCLPGGMQKHSGIYFCAIGGAGALCARAVKKYEVIAFPELGCESIKKLEFKDFPLIVGIDSSGNSIFSR